MHYGTVRRMLRGPSTRWETIMGTVANCLFPSRIHDSPHLGTRQYARILEGWVKELGLDPSDYGTHSMHRTKATLIYRWTKNLRAVQLLLGHSKLESTVRYLGIEVDDALEISEQTEIWDELGCRGGRPVPIAGSPRRRAGMRCMRQRQRIPFRASVSFLAQRPIGSLGQNQAIENSRFGVGKQDEIQMHRVFLASGLHRGVPNARA